MVKTKNKLQKTAGFSLLKSAVIYFNNIRNIKKKIKSGKIEFLEQKKQLKKKKKKKTMNFWQRNTSLTKCEKCCTIEMEVKVQKMRYQRGGLLETRIPEVAVFVKL